MFDNALSMASFPLKCYLKLQLINKKITFKMPWTHQPLYLKEWTFFHRWWCKNFESSLTHTYIM